MPALSVRKGFKTKHLFDLKSLMDRKTAAEQRKRNDNRLHLNVGFIDTLMVQFNRNLVITVGYFRRSN